MKTEIKDVPVDMVRKLGKLLSSSAGKEIHKIVDDIFGSRLSYTRGEPEHTAFLEGQKSVAHFMDNSVKLIKAEEN